ncbi:tRNA (N6-threonylcarbamoyladenosine(37)-N6)-methyltransferase TrmO [Jeongeupia sp. USM3]|uniref:tRNA (N6-threonylcarbamoyladenosine(37)-N6)-methyltransferase TrmO n=1 Tax=Jeongeupia sp. USM3 TaxID=1906741 RepID=UPI00089E0639|nr:tRNA (N6-threonylcarbamoyladenosine(37)-N6)-methyltransferase TrmO [Jeongeupia sp. USM3]AOY00297.1 tRNA (N6-threonylcarbamoyladenosine(37)-N6)-methyltransferase TrmO [Jeongeupia sp. USM3]
MNTDTFQISPLGYISTPFADKFGIPRQPRLAPHAVGTLSLLPPYDRSEAVRELVSFSHVWLTFVFHQTQGKWQPTVRPPRLGGNARVGVFASRSPFRPNSLGLSLVELAGVDTDDGVVLRFRGVDLVDGTPIVDIKPYLPYAESVPDAAGGFADASPPRLAVHYGEQALAQLAVAAPGHPQLAALIDEVLAQDPRPAYADDPARSYGVRLYCYDVKFRVADGIARVDAIEPAGST